MQKDMTNGSNKTHSDGEASIKQKKPKKKSKKKPKEEPTKEPKILITGETFGADEVLLKQVEKKLQKKISKKQKHRLIVFCPITSRVGSDVEAAMDKAKNAEGIILVLMHHTRDPDYSTAGTNWSETINNVDLDVHVLFHESVPGLLECSQNDKAVDQIVTFFKQRKGKQGSGQKKGGGIESNAKSGTEKIKYKNSKEKKTKLTSFFSKLARPKEKETGQKN